MMDRPVQKREVIGRCYCRRGVMFGGPADFAPVGD